MKTVKDVFAEYHHSLSKYYNLDEIEAITLLTVNEITGFSKAKIKAFPEQRLPEQQTKSLDETLIQLKTGKPIQYILGKTEFYGLPLKVNPSVLIPRPETEELVEWVISSARSSGLIAGNILDIGTGSGCIAISIKKYLPYFNVSAMDISIDALETAKINAALNDVDVNFIQQDILNIINESEKFEIIISNPPYVTLQDKTQMHTNVTDFEPYTALFVPENDPLIFYKAIADFTIKKLKPGGLLFFEINERYGEQTIKLLIGKLFKNIELRKDLSGRDRMLKATF